MSREMSRLTSGLQATRPDYDSVIGGAAICLLPDRGTIDVVGVDRAVWLHNLLTNAVRDLQVGEGSYAFATNVQGRILFDANVIVRDGFIRLVVDRRCVDSVLAHLNRYLITEDVRLVDCRDEYVYIAMVGPRAGSITNQLGAAHASVMSQISSTMVPLAGAPRLMIRDDLAGVFGVMCCIETDTAESAIDELMQQGESVNARRVSPEALRIARIEAGIPVFGEDIDETVLPAETGQLERAVSFVKGCYLGQEVVERMRSRGGLARRLVQLTIDADPRAIPRGAEISAGDRIAGRVTSCCYSYKHDATIGLGYVKASEAGRSEKLEVRSENGTFGCAIMRSPSADAQ